MQIQLSKDDQELFNTIAKSTTGDLLQGYIEKLIRHVESVRTQTTMSNESRIAVCDLLEENIINRLKMARGEKVTPPLTDYE